MIGSAIKKFAQANGLTVKNGVAYGVYNGIHLTMQEGAGWKSVSVAAYFETEEQIERIRGWLGDENRQTQYRIRGCSLTDLSVKPGSIQIAFLDNPGTMKKIEEFLPLFTAMLTSLEVKSAGVCHGCGMESGGTSDVLLGSNVYRLHDTCASKVEAELSEESEVRKSSGSIGMGILGAAIGAVIGMIPWVLVYSFGYMASFLGFLIGICAKKGYDLARGRQTKIKGVVILVCVLLAVVLAEFVAIVALNMSDGFAEGFTFGEVIEIVFSWIVTDGLVAVIKELAIGWLFAVLGIFQMVAEIFRGTKSEKLTKLN